MRWLLSALFALLLTTAAQAASPLYGGAYDSDAQAYFNALAGNSCATPTTAYKQAFSDFIAGNKADGNWNTQDYIFVIVTTDSCTASVNVAQPSLYKATITNTCTLSVANGLVGNGIDCQLAPGVNQNAMKRYTLNSAHWLVCIGGGGQSQTIGPQSGSAHSRLSTISNKASRLNASSDVTDTGGGLAGCHYADRTNSANMTTGKNGVVQSAAAATASTTVDTVPLTACLSGAVFCTNSAHFYYYDAGAPIPNESAYYTRIHTLIVALGAVGAP